MTDPSRKWSPLGRLAWRAGINAIRVEKTGKDWWLRGACPGCGPHTISRNISSEIGAAFIEHTPASRIHLRCNCGEPHEGRPEEKWPVGCGAAGEVLVGADGSVTVPDAGEDPEDLAAEEWAEAAIRERLPRLRAMATEWQKTVATVAGLFGAGTLFNADTAVRALGWIGKTGFAVLAVVAFLAASGSIVLASLASQTRLVEIPPDVVSRRRLRDQEFEEARLRLRWSRLLAGVAVVALLGSFLFRWFG